MSNLIEVVGDPTDEVWSQQELTLASAYIWSLDFSTPEPPQTPEEIEEAEQKRQENIEVNWRYVGKLLSELAIKNGCDEREVRDQSQRGPFHVVGTDEYDTDKKSREPKVLFYRTEGGEAKVRVYRPAGKFNSLTYEQIIPSLQPTSDFFGEPHTPIEIAKYVEKAIRDCLRGKKEADQSVTLEDSQWLN